MAADRSTPSSACPSLSPVSNSDASFTSDVASPAVDGPPFAKDLPLALRRAHRSNAGLRKEPYILVPEKFETSLSKTKELKITLKRKLDTPPSNKSEKRKSERDREDYVPSSRKKKKIPKKERDQDSSNDFYCWICHREGSVICCELCPRVYHSRCLQLTEEPDGDWFCPECQKIMKAECVESQSRAMAMLSVDQLSRLLIFSLQRMKHTWAQPFMKPVDAEAIPDYYEYIFHPMDLTTLEKNIKSKKYGSTDAFLTDAKWIMHNCIVYNGSNHKLTNNAKMIIKICKHEMSEIEICEDCYLSSCIKRDNWFCEPCRKPHALVWARLQGFPFWPAKALQTKKGQVDVRFFGQHDRAWVPVPNCYKISEDIPCQAKKKTNGLNNAIAEMGLHIEKIRKKFGKFEYAPHRSPYDPKNTKLKKYNSLVSAKTSSIFRKSPVLSIKKEPLDESDHLIIVDDEVSLKLPKNSVAEFNNTGSSKETSDIDKIKVTKHSKNTGKTKNTGKMKATVHKTEHSMDTENSEGIEKTSDTVKQNDTLKQNDTGNSNNTGDLQTNKANDTNTVKDIGKTDSTMNEHSIFEKIAAMSTNEIKEKKPAARESEKITETNIGNKEPTTASESKEVKVVSIDKQQPTAARESEGVTDTSIDKQQPTAARESEEVTDTSINKQQPTAARESEEVTDTSIDKQQPTAARESEEVTDTSIDKQQPTAASESEEVTDTAIDKQSTDTSKDRDEKEEISSFNSSSEASSDVLNSNKKEKIDKEKESIIEDPSDKVDEDEAIDVENVTRTVGKKNEETNLKIITDHNIGVMNEKTDEKEMDTDTSTSYQNPISKKGDSLGEMEDNHKETNQEKIETSTDEGEINDSNKVATDKGESNQQEGTPKRNTFMEKLGKTIESCKAILGLKSEVEDKEVEIQSESESEESESDSDSSDEDIEEIGYEVRRKRSCSSEEPMDIDENSTENSGNISPVVVDDVISPVVDDITIDEEHSPSTSGESKDGKEHEKVSDKPEDITVDEKDNSVFQVNENTKVKPVDGGKETLPTEPIKNGMDDVLPLSIESTDVSMKPDTVGSKQNNNTGKKEDDKMEVGTNESTNLLENSNNVEINKTPERTPPKIELNEHKKEGNLENDQVLDHVQEIVDLVHQQTPGNERKSDDVQSGKQELKDNNVVSKTNEDDDGSKPQTSKDHKTAVNYGQIAARIRNFDKYVGKVSDVVKEALIEMYSEVAENSVEDETKKVMRGFQEEVDFLKWRHTRELEEFKHVAALTIAEMRSTFDHDKSKALETLRKKMEAEKQTAIESTKKKKVPTATLR